MSEHFSLNINFGKSKTFIEMKIYTGIVNTCDIPDTFSILKQTLPAILKSKCYNYENLPFYKEVRKTELGHLFEHILLEYLCKLRMLEGSKAAEFSGFTNWNWKKHSRGTFHITINAGYNVKNIFHPAIEKSSRLITTILSSRLCPEPDLPFDRLPGLSPD